MTVIQEKIQKLAESVFTHEALNNRFYDQWISGPLPLRQVEIFARNYLIGDAEKEHKIQAA